MQKLISQAEQTAFIEIQNAKAVLYKSTIYAKYYQSDSLNQTIMKSGGLDKSDQDSGM